MNDRRRAKLPKSSPNTKKKIGSTHKMEKSDFSLRINKVTTDPRRSPSSLPTAVWCMARGRGREGGLTKRDAEDGGSLRRLVEGGAARHVR
jgi:hypothetical protein